MGKIRLLSETVASQVAAGEVVERPASVVKELVENSIDAGARSISVEFSRGGSASIIVSDDGSGMDREDALLCLERHATSKIRRSEDLFAISTLGFRGEALPSIASVSKFKLATCERHAESGVEVLINGGRMETVRECGQAPGTRIEVRSLFYNVPARKKFLRAESTEGAHIVSQVQVLALANPAIAFVCIRDGKEVFRTAATRDLSARIRDLLGKDFQAALAGADGPSEFEGITVSGFVGKPSAARRDRSHQFVFLNGRAISAPAVQAGLREALHGRIEKGLQPSAVLHLQMAPASFDCNVHPAKREVRFRNADQVREAVRRFGERALSAPPPAQITSLPAPQEKREAEAPPAFHASPSSLAFGASQPKLFPAVSVSPENRGGESFSDDRPPFVPLSSFGSRYLLMEKAGGLVIADLRAATERIIYEKLLRQIQTKQPDVQRLLFVSVIELQPKDYDWICANREILAASGIIVEPFGGRSVKMEGLPSLLSEIEPANVLHQTMDALRAAGSHARGRVLEDAIARSMSGLAGARFAGLPQDAAVRLVADLMRCDLPYACPMGRPTMIEWSSADLERRFGRGA